MTISDLCITNQALPLDIADALLYHIRIIQPVERQLKMIDKTQEVICSKKSGYRPVSYEKSKGRKGSSQHTFKEKHLNGTGAVDWTLKNDSEEALERFLALLIDMTGYMRLAKYDTFIHCDFKDTNSGLKEYYESDSNSNWTFKYTV